MQERRLLCIKSRYSDCAWIDELGVQGWAVEAVDDLTSAHRLLNDRTCLTGLLVPGPIDQGACQELDGFLRAHGNLEWVGAFEPHILEMPACRDLIVDHLFDHHTTPINPSALSSTLGHAFGHASLRRASHQAQVPVQDALIVGHSAAATELLRQVLRVAKVQAPVLVSGESGSGKELTAQAIHRHSSRAGGPFVPVNCGAIQATLI